ncbi:MAG: putative peptidoglycan glycosyltransferase FtsW [Pseudomonadota bacterium]|nr:putative peptidoglycan glycosyltransferase FtsW [Pseudomonadota bacterium]
MIAPFDRTDQSVISRWWWTVDHLTLLVLLGLAGLGVLLVTTASPPVADRIGLDSYYFANRHLMLLIPALLAMVMVSLMSPVGVRRIALLLLAGSMVVMVAVLVFSDPIKGAQRWIRIFGFSVQPSEFVKPAFAVTSAWLFARSHSHPGFPGHALGTVLYGLVLALLLLQPDIGMSFVVTIIWLAQFFLAGLPMVMIAAVAVLGISGMVAAYFVFPHFANRINLFLDPTSGDSYQVQRSLEAFREGGLTGTGPGHGTVKYLLPDAHSDFVFAVAGEEMGLMMTLPILALFAFVVLRGLHRSLKIGDLFVLLACTGLIIQFGLQAMIHMGSALRLIPTKGMTLPLLSYGGSSLIALGLGLGMMLALTRKQSMTGDRP